MSITVLDTCSAMLRILRAPAADRVDLLRVVLEPTRGMYRYHPGEVDLVAMHLGSPATVVKQSLTLTSGTRFDDTASRPELQEGHLHATSLREGGLPATAGPGRVSCAACRAGRTA